MKTWIRIEQCTDTVLRNNRAGAFLYKTNDRMTDTHNEIAPAQRSPNGDPPSDSR